MKNNASLIYNFFLVVGDVFALILAFLSAFFVRGRLINTPVAHPVHVQTYLVIFLCLLPFWIIMFALIGLYNSSIYENRFRELGRLLVGSFIGMLFVVFWNFLSLNPILPAKLVPIFGFIFGFIFLVIFRNLLRFIRTTLFLYRIGLTDVLLVGNTPMTEELSRLLKDSRQSGYQVAGVVGSNLSAKKFPQLKHFDTFAEAVKRIKAENLHGIIQTELYADEARNREILEFAQANHILYRFVPGNSELFVGNIDVELFRSSIPVITVRQTALFGWGRIVKRLTDLTIGLVCFIIALPIMFIVGLAEKLSNPRGKVFYKQRRLTRFNQQFTVYKFRTIKPQYNGLTPEEAFIKMGKPEVSKRYRELGDQIPNDPRFSSLGRFLRRFSLDELPQLLNVVKGDISLVGPRALVIYELEEFEKKNVILSVKSGLTGLAIVSGRRDLSFEERRKLDMYYVQNWSFWLDLTILAKTFRILINGAGAS
jgi:exopolysaccharide biosynthesis polyprenyl glycosylphosphotransferase